MGCHVKNCNGEEEIRGICKRCYNALIALRNSELLKYSMDELVNMQILFKAKPLGRPKKEKKKKSPYQVDIAVESNRMTQDEFMKAHKQLTGEWFSGDGGLEGDYKNWDILANTDKKLPEIVEDWYRYKTGKISSPNNPNVKQDIRIWAKNYNDNIKS